MKGMLRILVSVTALLLTLYLVTGSGLSEAWAKGSGSSHGASSSNNAQDKKDDRPTASEIVITKSTDMSSTNLKSRGQYTGSGLSTGSGHLYRGGGANTIGGTQ